MSPPSARARTRAFRLASTRVAPELCRPAARARFAAFSCVLALAIGVWSSSARADASVIVELKRADGSSAEGLVRLSKGDAKHECTTKNGRCQIAAVPGGTYNVEVVQADKPAGKPKRVMIPPAGEVKLIVAAQ